MPARHSDQTKVRTRLAAARVQRGIPQRTMARCLGMGLTAYRALERGRDPNPRLRHLVNAAAVLQVGIDAIIEPEWRTWWSTDSDPQPPAPAEVWHTAPSSPVAQERSLRQPTQRELLEQMARRGHPTG